MRDRIRSWVVRLLRIPPDPRVPDGEEKRVRVFRASPNFYRYNLARWGLGQFGALTGLLVGLVLVRVFDASLGRFFWYDLVVWIEILAWIGFLLQLPVTFAMLHLDYQLRWYIVTDRSLRIREGLTRIREQTMTFANIQNMAIRQGPLQRLLGIADMEVHTAGGGGAAAKEEGSGQSSGQAMHVGIFRGVDNAAEIRDMIRERVRLHRDAGLGDPDDAGPRLDALTDSAALSSPAVDAARDLLDEIRLLRRAATAAGRQPTATRSS
jgi:membrane protein YdbS with pleckstrin-like domain